MSLEIIAVESKTYLGEGTHDVVITNAELENFASGDASLAVTFENLEGETHKQMMPTVGYRTWNDEGTTSKNPDFLSQAEKDSGELMEDVDANGVVKSNYAMRVKAKDAKGVLRQLKEPKRVVSAIKTKACMEIIGRLASSCGIVAGTKITEKDLVGKELQIVLQRKAYTPFGGAQTNYVRLVDTKPKVEEFV